MKEFSFEKALKFNREEWFFDINFLWIPGLGKAVERLYHTSIRPETIVILSLFAGVASSFFYAQNSYALLLAAIILIQLKNFLDSIDGHLARAKEMTSRIGRFLDSLSDAVVYFCLFTALGLHISTDNNILYSFLLAYLAMISAFLQCSIFNYYTVTYKTRLRGKGINRTDESFEEDESLLYQGLSGKVLLLLQVTYRFVYGWQDILVTKLDAVIVDAARRKKEITSDNAFEKEWYCDKTFLSALSVLCFGTQIFLLSCFTLANKIELFLILTVTAGNLYTAMVLGIKVLVKRFPACYKLHKFQPKL